MFAITLSKLRICLSYNKIAPNCSCNFSAGNMSDIVVATSCNDIIFASVLGMCEITPFVSRITFPSAVLLGTANVPSFNS